MSHKYGAVRTVVDNITFASKAEAHRYRQLKLLLAGGKITDLEMQKRYKITVNGQLICTYVSDFDYVENGQKVTEDVKGMRTSVYKIKRKLMMAVHGIDIRESK